MVIGIDELSAALDTLLVHPSVLHLQTEKL